MRSISSRHLAVTAICLIPFGASGDEPVVTLNPLVVTPTLSSVTVDGSLSSVTVIDRETLDRQQPKELSEVLRGQPGIDLSTSGSFGKNTSVFTRGTGSESTVLLIDGVRIRSATTGGAPWEFIPPQLLERVEIVRGPRSSLYGADAVGGVIQAFTPDGRDGDSRWAQAGAGLFDSHEYGAGFAGRRGGTAVSVAANHFDTDGEPVRAGGEDKGFRNTSGLARVTHQFDNGMELGALGFLADGNTEFEGGATDFKQQVVAADAFAPINRSWSSRIQVSEARDEQDTDDGASVFDTRSRALRWDNTAFLGEHQLVVGTEFLEDRVDGTTQFTEDSRYNLAAYTQGLVHLDSTDIQLSLRVDENEAFSNRVTGGAASAHALDDRHRLRISYGTAFRAPTFNDLYFPFQDFGFFAFEGNPNLAPERSQTAELGLRGQYQRTFWDVALFQTHVDDMISNQEGDDGVTRPTNVDRARIQGAELAAGARLGSWDLRGALTLQDPRVRSGENRNNRLPRRATRNLRLDVDRALGSLTVGATGVFEGDRYDDVDNEQRLGGFALLHLRAGWEFAHEWSARLTVNNVFDRAYETVAGFANAGRSAFLSVRYGDR